MSEDVSGGILPEMQSSSAMEDALAALISLGYPRAAAMNALKGEDKKGLQAEELIRAALKKLF